MMFKNKKVVVTGATRGIGRVIAEHFAREGADVALCARNPETLKRVMQTLQEKYHVTIRTYSTDLREFRQINSMIRHIVQDFGRVDVLVNNAGIPEYGYPIDSDDPLAEKVFHEMVDLNFMAYWYTIRAVIPVMKEAGGGVIVNIASARAHGGVPNQSAYCATKAGIIGLTRAAAVELAPYGIRVVSLSPGAIQLDDSHWILRRFGSDVYEQYVKKYPQHRKLSFLANQPLKRIGKPDDVAWAVLFLASERAGFITGVDLPVDGGETAALCQPATVDLELYTELYREIQRVNAWLDKQRAQGSS